MKKFSPLAMVVILMAVFSLSLAVPNAGAVTIAELIAQIQELQRQLAQLQSQQGTTTAWCHDFNMNIRMEDSGIEVASLHIALKKEGFDPKDEGRGDYFNENTASAVSGFQQKYANEILSSYGLKYGTGFVGKSTRAKLNKLYGCGGVVTPTPTITPSTQPLFVLATTGGTVNRDVDGVCGPNQNCTSYYTTGFLASLVATPATGYTFSGWSGDACAGTTGGTNVVCKVSMTSSKSVTATFTTITTTTPAPTTPSITVSLDSMTPSAKQIVMGTTNNNLAAFRISNTSSEDVQITSLNVTENSVNGATVSSFSSIEIYKSGVMLMGATSFPVSGGWKYSFPLNSLSNPLVVPQNSSIGIEVRGNVASYASGGAKSNGLYTFSIPSSADVVARGANSAKTATVSITGSVTGKTMQIVRTKLNVNSLSVPSGADIKSSANVIANINFSADPAYDAKVYGVVVTLTGTVLTNGVTVAGGDLIDADTGSSWGSGGTAGCTIGTLSKCVLRFFPSYTIAAGSVKVVKLKINSTGFNGGSLSVSINSIDDITWYDGATNDLGLEATKVPLTSAMINYQGMVVTTPTPSITVLSPNGGEVLSPGSAVDIKWSNTNYRSSVVNLSLYRSNTIPGNNGYSSVSQIGSLAQPNDGVETWIIPSTISSGNNYFIRIGLDVQDPQTGMDTYDDSNAPFSIAAVPAPAPTVTFTANPTTVISGQPVTFAWSSTNTTSCQSIGAAMSSVANLGTSGTVTSYPSATAIYDVSCTGTGGSTTKSVTVNVIALAPSTYTLSVSKSGSGSGTVATNADTKINCGSTCSASFGSGLSAFLVATPATGSTFTGWSGDTCMGTTGGTNTVCMVSMTSAKSVTATFTTTTATTPAPVITSISPTSAKAGSAIYIVGSNFGIDSNILLDGTMTIPPVSQTSTTLIFNLPTYASVGSHSVQVKAMISGVLSNSVSLNVVVATAATPTLTASILDSVKAQLDLIQKAINDWRR